MPLKWRNVLIAVLVLVLFATSTFYLRNRTVSSPQVTPDSMFRFSASGVPDWSVRACTGGEVAARWYSQAAEDRGIMSQLYTNKGCAGVFAEMGALDGKLISNTLAWENSFKWNGVLIEANPGNFRKLVVNRNHTKNIWSATCDSNTQMLMMGWGREMARIVSGETPKAVPVPCRPLADILRTSDITTIDVFFLDVEGSELEVLRTMDWTVAVGLWVVEVQYPYDKDKDVKDAKVTKLLLSKGYKASSVSLEDFYFSLHKRKPGVHEALFEHPLYRTYLQQNGFRL